MSNQPLTIVANGMVTGVGLDAPNSCAAIRAAIDNFQETRFIDSGGEWIRGCEVPLEQPWRGTRKLAKMLARALTECAEDGGIELTDVPVLICLAEKDRPGRLDDLANRVFFETQEELYISFHNESSVVEHGRVGGVVAMKKARAMIHEAGHKYVLIAGVDSLLNAQAIKIYEEQERLLTSKNSNGFIPGEAAGAIIVSAVRRNGNAQLYCTGMGFGIEKATIDSGLPLRGDGLTGALNKAFEEANESMNTMNFRIVDVTGEQYWFKETALVLGRLLRVHKEGFPMWHATDCVGEVGAAVHFVNIGYAKAAFEKKYSPGTRMLQHFSNNDGKRCAAVYYYGQAT